MTGYNTNGQSNFKPGYVITNQNDTIHGLIDSRGEINNMQSCLFKKDHTAELNRYSPGEIYGYRFVEDGKFFVTRYIDVDDVRDTVFVEYLLQGISDFYYYRNANYSSYFIDAGDGVLHELRSTQITSEIDGRHYSKEDPRFKGTLNYIWVDTPEMQNDINRLRLNHRSVINIGRKYHDFVCEDDEECIIFEKVIPFATLNIQPKIGIGIAYLKFYDVWLKSIDFDPSVSFNLGVDFIFQFPRWNDRLSFGLGAMHSKEDFKKREVLLDSGVNKTYRDSRIEASQITGDMFFQYGFPSGRYRPYVRVGSFMTSFYNTNYTFFRETFGHEYSISYLEAEKYPDLFWGGSIGLGMNISLWNSLNAAIDCGYRMGTVIPHRHTDISVFFLNAGIVF